ncbi:hypothetical protein M3Y94_00132000 [Aphelenchoides besseyi]|nr:hypothetical protein M3Y94_00132000 [Aphelenchoides besseyi]
MSGEYDSRSISQLIAQVDVLITIVAIIAVLLLLKASVTIVHIFSLYYRAKPKKKVPLSSVSVKGSKKKKPKSKKNKSKKIEEAKKESF